MSLTDYYQITDNLTEYDKVLSFAVGHLKRSAPPQHHIFMNPRSYHYTNVKGLYPDIVIISGTNTVECIIEVAPLDKLKEDYVTTCKQYKSIAQTVYLLVPITGKQHAEDFCKAHGLEVKLASYTLNASGQPIDVEY